MGSDEFCDSVSMWIGDSCPAGCSCQAGEGAVPVPVALELCHLSLVLLNSDVRRQHSTISSCSSRALPKSCKGRKCGCHSSARRVAGRVHVELVSGGPLQSLLEANLLLVALNPGEDVQGQPYVLLIRAVIFLPLLETLGHTFYSCSSEPLLPGHCLISKYT